MIWLNLFRLSFEVACIIQKVPQHPEKVPEYILMLRKIITTIYQIVASRRMILKLEEYSIII